ncbi:MAG: hypothetical protein AABX03_05220 [Nanoarchaeota archaeon]
MEVVIVDELGLRKKIERFKEGGKDKIHILSDFDRTFTIGLINGKTGVSVIGQIRAGGYLTPDYPQKANDLFAKYHPIEIDTSISKDEKIIQMSKWWREHFQLIIESNLNKQTISKIIKERPLEFREGTRKFTMSLHKLNIPLIFITASVGDMVSEYIKKEGILFDNVHVIGNNFEYDSSGKVIGVKFPIIHTLNKSEASIHKLKIYKELLDRKNVLLLGDSLEDIHMVAGFPYKNLIKIGFLNENIENNLDKFKEAFDVVITGDGDFSEVNKVLKEILD